jgi:hypothetical protein
MITKLSFIAAISLLFVVSCASVTFAQKSADRVWTKISESSIAHKGERIANPGSFLTFRLDQKAMQGVLSNAPLEFSEAARNRTAEIIVPDSDGNYVRFRIEESPILSPELAKQFPTWKTYQGYGIDDPTATARFDVNDNGFHGYVLSSKGAFIIDPYQKNDTTNYQVYLKTSKPKGTYHCNLDEMFSTDKTLADLTGLSLAPEFSHGTQIRTYRLGIATTPQATVALGGQTTAFASVQTTVNRIVGVYRKDLAVSFTLVSGTNMIFNTTTTIPPTTYPNSGSGDLAANQSNMDAILGSANYDAGHVFGSSDNGVANLNSICSATLKARGYSGQPNPVGDGFDIDYVAHEMGHQFGANHTFNAQANCNTVPAGSRKEPGAAITIMGYAGICSGNSNPAGHSIDTFHVHSQTEIINFLTTGGGSTCGALAGTNAIPVIGALTNYNIPVNTPFTLTATATDGDSNPLTYTWEQNDDAGNLASYPGTTDDDDTSFVFRPGFRSYIPTASGSRTFPSLTYILNNANEAPLSFANSTTNPLGVICNPIAGGTCISGEDLPSSARTMNFRVTVRDGQGGVADGNVALSVSGANGLTGFSVTAPNTGVTWAGNSKQTVTWNLSGSNGAPINAANVRILYSSDGGQTFPTVVLASTPNDGTQSIVVPSVASSTARIKIEAVGNVFFDISDVNFSTTNAPVRSRSDFDGDGRTDVSVFRPSNGVWYQLRSTAGFGAQQWGLSADIPTPGDFDNDGKTDLAVFRPDPNGVFYVFNSASSTATIYPFGLGSDKPVVGDYDGDGRADMAVFRTSNNTWYIQRSTAGLSQVTFGQAGDVPLAGDFDGDGKTDITVFRNGTWFSLPSSNPVNPVVTNWGLATDRLVPADYDGDGKDDVAVFRPSNGAWYIIRSGGGVTITSFGTSGDIPSPGDYDGDGTDDIGVYRNGVWYVNRSTAGLVITSFGLAGDTAIPNKYLP